jgi:hypothetical protein
MRKLLMLVLAGVVLQATTAHGQRIRGQTFEDETREPIAGAMVELFGPDSARLATVQTDSAGAFVLMPGRHGDFVIRVSHFAYLPMDSAALSIRPGETLVIEVRMAARAIPLDPVVVTSRGDPRLRGFHERMRGHGFGRFVTREDIESRPGARTTDLLRGIPGIQLIPTNTGFGNVITMRGGGASGRCLPTIYVDGMPAAQYADATIDAFLMPAMLEGVEVYSGITAPAALYSNSGCGVVAFWTRRDGGRPFSWRRIFTAAGFVGAVVTLTSLLTR